MSYQVRFLKNNSANSLPSFVDWQVMFMNWKLPGGADKAVLKGNFPGLDNSQLDSFFEAGINMPVEIVSPTGEVVWQGWVETIAYYSGQLKTSCSLREMHNRIIVRYPRSGADASPFERWAYTNWQEDPESVVRFGEKEKLLTIHQADACLADQALRQGFDGLNSLPSFNIDMHRQDGAPYFEIIARGWWQRLSWILDQEEQGKITHLGGGKSSYDLGKSTGNTRMAQSFLVTQTDFQLSHIWLRVSVTGQPADDLQVAIHADDNDSPGELLGQADSPANSLDGSWAWVHWELLTALALSSQTKYWLVVKRSGAVDAANYYEVESDDGPGYTDGQLKRWDGSSWQPLGQDLRFGLIAQADAVQLIGGVLQRPELASLFPGFVNWQIRELPVYRWRPLEMNCLDRIEEWLKGDLQISALVDSQRNLNIIPLPRKTENPLQLSTNHAPYTLSVINGINAANLLGCSVLVDLPRYQNKNFIQSISWRMGKGYSWQLSALKP